MRRRTAVVPMGRQFRRKRGATRRTMLARCFGRTVLPPFSLPFFPLLSHTVSPKFLSLFSLRPSYSYLLLLLPPSILFSLQRFSIPFRYSNEKPNGVSYAVSLSPPSFSSSSFCSFFLSPCCCAVTFPFRIVALLPFYHLAEQQLVAQRGPWTGIKGLPIVLRQLRTTTYRSLNRHDQRNRPAKIDVFPNRWENNARRTWYGAMARVFVDASQLSQSR